MTLTTPVKAISGIAATSTAVAGSALVYKYATDLYAIEKVAIETTNWKINDVQSEDVKGKSDHKLFKVAISVDATSNDNKQGINKGAWTCTIITSSFSSNEETTKKPQLKKVLEKYFPNYSSANQPSTVQVEELNRKRFVNSCSENRKTIDSENNTVSSEVNVSLDSLEEDLTTIFGLISLNTVEKKVYSEKNLVFNVADFSLNSDGTPNKVTGNITVTNKSGETILNSGETWTCTMEGTTNPSNTLATGDVATGLKGQIEKQLETEEGKKGLVTSCARNRTSDNNANSVVSTLKLTVSKAESGDTNLKFDLGQLSKVFKGNWTNL